MFKRTLIFTMACCASAALMMGCGGGESGSGSDACPETCPEGQHCDETTGFECVDNQVIPEKKCPETCEENQHCDATTDYKCVANGDPEKKCPESCPTGQHCDASTNYQCIDGGGETNVSWEIALAGARRTVG